MTLPNNGGTIAFKYDPFGRRIYKSSSSSTTIYAYDGDNAVETTNQSGGILSRFAQGQNIDEPLGESASGTTSYYEADGLGSITSLTNGAGAVAQTYTYDSFGNITHSTGSLANPFQYTARDFDSETGLYYYRARYYDPSSGRFVSEDPSAFRAGINFYSYADNVPVSLSDASGLQAGWGGAFGNGAGWAWGHNGSTTYLPGSPFSDQMSQSSIGQRLTSFFLGKNKGKPCNEWEGVSDFKGSFGLRGLFGNLSNGTAEFVGSATGAVTILAVNCAKHTVTAGFSLTNTTSLRSLLYGVWPNSWNVTTPGRPLSNWTQTYDWYGTFSCDCCD